MFELTQQKQPKVIKLYQNMTLLDISNLYQKMKQFCIQNLELQGLKIIQQQIDIQLMTPFDYMQSEKKQDSIFNQVLDTKEKETQQVMENLQIKETDIQIYKFEDLKNHNLADVYQICEYIFDLIKKFSIVKKILLDRQQFMQIQNKFKQNSDVNDMDNFNKSMKEIYFQNDQQDSKKINYIVQDKLDILKRKQQYQLKKKQKEQQIFQLKIQNEQNFIYNQDKYLTEQNQQQFQQKQKNIDKIKNKTLYIQTQRSENFEKNRENIKNIQKIQQRALSNDVQKHQKCLEMSMAKLEVKKKQFQNLFTKRKTLCQSTRCNKVQIEDNFKQQLLLQKGTIQINLVQKCQNSQRFQQIQSQKRKEANEMIYVKSERQKRIDQQNNEKLQLNLEQKIEKHYNLIDNRIKSQRQLIATVSLDKNQQIQQIQQQKKTRELTAQTKKNKDYEESQKNIQQANQKFEIRQKKFINDHRLKQQLKLEKQQYQYNQIKENRTQESLNIVSQIKSNQSTSQIFRESQDDIWFQKLKFQKQMEKFKQESLNKIINQKLPIKHKKQKKSIIDESQQEL